MRKILKYKLLVISIVIFQLFYFPSSPAMADISNVLYVKGDCKLVIEDAHLSKSLLKSKKSVTAVKANVSSQCKYFQQKVIFQIWLYKKIGENWIFVQKFTREVTKPTSSPFNIEVKDAWVECKNYQRTRYLVMARSWATIAGKEYASRVGRSQNEVELACGV